MSSDKVQTPTMIFDVFLELIVTYWTCHNSLLGLVISVTFNGQQITAYATLPSGPSRYCSLCPEALPTAWPLSANPYLAGDILDGISLGSLSRPQEAWLTTTLKPRRLQPTTVKRLGYASKGFSITTSICSSIDPEQSSVSWRTRWKISFFWPSVQNKPSVYLSINSQASFFEYCTFWGSRWFWNQWSFSPITINIKIKTTNHYLSKEVLKISTSMCLKCIKIYFNAKYKSLHGLKAN